MMNYWKPHEKVRGKKIVDCNWFCKTAGSPSFLMWLMLKLTNFYAM